MSESSTTTTTTTPTPPSDYLAISTTSGWSDKSPTPIQSALSRNSVASLGLDSTVVNDNPYLFNNCLDYGLPITNQKSSGRCWLFATCNLIRMVGYTTLKEKYGKIANFELSQSYLYFWDKLERYHRSLRYYVQISKTTDTQKDRYLYQLYQDPLGDGGQWDMAKEIVKKYGVVPREVFPDSHHAKSSREMNKILTRQLTSDFATLDSTDTDVIESAITIMTNRVFKMLVGFLGQPPKKFTWTFKGGTDVIHTLRDITPKDFVDTLNFKPDDWVSVIHDPRREHPYNKYYSVKYLGNVYNRHVGWLNLDIARVNELAKKSIDQKHPVWFGCDVGAEWDRTTGVQHPGIIDTAGVTGLTTCQDKESRLKTFTSLPNHAMLITGYHQDKDKITRWKVENSWGKTSGTDGFLLMTKEWMDQYVFQILVQKSLLNSDEKAALGETPYDIEPWDPLGTLA